MAGALLGIDVGSSSTKVGLFSLQGQKLALASRPYPTLEPQSGWKEQQPEHWWTSVSTALAEIRHETPASDILGVGVTGHISSLTFVNASGRPLRPAIGFQDQRARGEIEELYKRFSRDDLAVLLGIDLPPAATWPLPRLLWFCRYEPATLEKSHRVLQAKDYINFCLTGEFASDASSCRGLVNLADGLPPQQVFSKLGLPAQLLPKICDPGAIVGRVSTRAAAETGLPDGVPVAGGWNDLNAAVLGSGAVHAGESFNITGTSEHLGVVTEKEYRVPELLCGPYLPGKKLLYGATLCGGGSLQWYCKAFRSELDQLLAQAEQAPAGSESLFFLPYLEGERSPIWDPMATGAFVGIRSIHSQRHFVRAILEGVAFGLLQILELVVRSGQSISEPMRLAAGTARADLWNQIKTDVFGFPCATPEAGHAGVLGAAILGGVAAGIYEDCETAAAQMVRLERQYSVSESRHRQYQRQYLRFCELYPALQECFARMYRSRMESEP